MSNSKRVLVLDFDDVLMATGMLVDDEIEKINYRASNQYQNEINRMFQSGEIDSETYRILLEEYFDLKDRILEEVDDDYKGRIDYSKIISPENFYPMVVEYINYLIKCGRYDEVYIESHFNVPGEVQRKAEIIQQYFPGVEFIPVPFHIEQYKAGIKRKRTNKAEYIKQYLKRKGIENFTLIDDSSSNIREWREAGGIGINFNAHGDDISRLHSLNPFSIITHEDSAVLKLPEGRGK